MERYLPKDVMSWGQILQLRRAQDEANRQEWERYFLASIQTALGERSGSKKYLNK